MEPRERAEGWVARLAERGLRVRLPDVVDDQVADALAAADDALDGASLVGKRSRLLGVVTEVLDALTRRVDRSTFQVDVFDGELRVQAAFAGWESTHVPGIETATVATIPVGALPRPPERLERLGAALEVVVWRHVRPSPSYD
jgi:hypothetical protein